jgi:tRNA1Val (adenine37-N6)-methyltransferase
MEPYFRFKQFSVRHDRSALKVTTDAVIFGAWLADKIKDATFILDIGAGCCLLSLMIAQSNSAAVITALEIDDNSVLDAIENISHSPWSDRLFVVHQDFNTYNAKEKFDFIVSNPPFFINSISSAEKQMARAKHTISLTYEALVKGIHESLLYNGTAALMIPSDNLVYLEMLLSEFSFNVYYKTYISGSLGKKPHIVFLLFGREQKSETEDCIIIRDERNQYSMAYLNLTKDFYI